MSCRFCGAALAETFADLGMSPLSNAFIAPERANAMEKFYPLHAYVCSACRLVQLAEFESPAQIFGDYLYFSSYSESWLRHAEAYAQAMIARFGLGPQSQMIEIASNDGYLLQYFQRAGIPVLGIEPAANVAAVAIGQGIATEIAFFGRITAHRLKEAGRSPDLIAANNVLAHVPDLNDFVGGLKLLLAPAGIVTVEFPHLQRLIDENQFDTIYHEHFSYFSLLTAERIFAHHGLTVFDVEELPTHGGSLRLYLRHAESAAHPVSAAVGTLRRRELDAGLAGAEPYRRFAETVAATKGAVLEFLIGARRAGKKVVGYGAPAKGNTLLNYCGIRSDMIAFTVDRSPHKQGLLLPGTHIPIRDPAALIAARPDYVFILPWNLRDEIMAQMVAIRSWGGAFVVPIPRLQVLP
jgi:2-polyprenyl-3-methyl-5-hydroxy-6-metoxy-1,4-benzoquinol methylase